MTDEIGAAPTKRRGGWTKGKPRKTVADVKAAADRADPATKQMAFMKLKMKARPNWESDDFGMEAGSDMLNIARETIDAFARDGVALQWATREVRGMEMKRQQRQTAAEGWTPVHVSDFDGILDNGKFLPKGVDEYIQVGDCQLVARPMALHQKAKRAEQTLADEHLDGPRQMLQQGINATGGRHPSVRNQINVHLDRVEIPD
jgi:hypothetical protein